MRYQAAILAALVAAGCTTPVLNTTTQATLRNDPPATCTDAQMQACPAVAMEACPDGKDPVIDYSSDCCAHFSCQPACQSAKVCERTPAPACPVGTKLWIGTALEDCCPAYRCEPDDTCSGKDVACTLSLPYCGPGVNPVVMGQGANCCPIYQCPCMKSSDPAAPADQSMCGCTYPVCKPGEELVCKGANICGYPCECMPAHGSCVADSDCPADARCDVTSCLLPPPMPVDAGPAQCPADKCGPAPMMPNTLCPDGKLMSGPSGRCLVNADGSCGWEILSCPVPTECDPAKCGPALGMPSKLCPDGKTTAGPTGRCVYSPDSRCVWEIGQCPPPACDPTECGPAPMRPNELCEDGKTVGGPTGRCLRDPAGVCGWEILPCPPTTGCFGVCVPNVKTGCKADLECPTGQRCELSCTGWGCATDPNGTTACACDLMDPSCYCDPTTGACKGQECSGQCVPVAPVCDKVDPAACPAIAPACDNGAQPVAVGSDPITCCPIFKCPSCDKTDQPIACPMPAMDCPCLTTSGTDPTTCCPVYQCGKMDPTTNKCL